MALNKRALMTELAQTCDKNDIPREKILITCGAASVIHGLRQETNDIDVEVLDEHTWNNLGWVICDDRKHYEALNLMPAAEVINIGNIDFHWRGGLPKDTKWHKIGVYRGFMCSTKIHILEDRIKLGRKKDIEEIIKLLPYRDSISKELKDMIPDLLIRLNDTTLEEALTNPIVIKPNKIYMMCPFDNYQKALLSHVKGNGIDSDTFVNYTMNVEASYPLPLDALCEQFIDTIKDTIGEGGGFSINVNVEADTSNDLLAPIKRVTVISQLLTLLTADLEFADKLMYLIGPVPERVKFFKNVEIIKLSIPETEPGLTLLSVMRLIEPK